MAVALGDGQGEEPAGCPGFSRTTGWRSSTDARTDCDSGRRGQVAARTLDVLEQAELEQQAGV